MVAWAMNPSQTLRSGRLFTEGIVDLQELCTWIMFLKSDRSALLGYDRLRASGLPGNVSGKRTKQ